jgi:hypothetical protein
MGPRGRYGRQRRRSRPTAKMEHGSRGDDLRAAAGPGPCVGDALARRSFDLHPEANADAAIATVRDAVARADADAGTTDGSAT